MQVIETRVRKATAHWVPPRCMQPAVRHVAPAAGASDRVRRDRHDLPARVGKPRGTQKQNQCHADRSGRAAHQVKDAGAPDTGGSGMTCACCEYIERV